MEFKYKDKSIVEEWLIEQCHILRKSISCDFTGIALQKNQGMDIIWPYVSGNVNEKHKYITVRYGKGIAGKVLSSSSSMLIEEFPHKILGKSTDYPIMLAKNIVSAYAVPILLNGIPKGTILIGYRKVHPFTEEEFDRVKETALTIQEYLPNYFV